MITISSREKRMRPLHHGQLEIAVLFFFDQPLLLISFEGRRSRSVRRAVVVFREAWCSGGGDGEYSAARGAFGEPRRSRSRANANAAKGDPTPTPPAAGGDSPTLRLSNTAPGKEVVRDEKCEREEFPPPPVRSNGPS